MSQVRQVDVKALVSHIVRGDGLDKCRICMGDTSQGQVHLGDTVMMDGDKPVTLSELLEVITGVEVVIDEALPPAICLSCSTSAIQAAGFRTLVQNADHQWMNTLQLLEHVPSHKYSKNSNRICALINDNDIYISDERTIPSSLLMIEDKADHIAFRRVGKQHDCQCPTCGKKFLYPQYLYKHLKESADLIRACNICADIMSRDDLVQHLIEKHEENPYSCKKCPAVFLHGKQYKEHLLKAHAPGACTCGDCGRTFKSKPAYHAHQSVHSLRFCPNCDTQFRNQSCYFYHVKKCCNMDRANANKSKITVTLQKKQNKQVKMGLRGGSANKECICDYCKKKFAGKKFVAAHIQIVHTKETHRPCVYCGKLFAAAHITTHLKTHGQQSFECHQCGVILKSKLGFNQHLRLHTGERPYTCQYCGESFSASSRRSEHIRYTHKKSEIVLKHVCNQCPARFRLPHKLKQHIKTVHGEGGDDESWYECGECKEKFASCRSLLHHSKKHKSPV